MMQVKSLYRPSTVPAARAIELAREIERFNAEYCAVLDANEVERWPGFFAEDALYRVTARENVERGLPVGLVYAEGRAMMIDRAVAIARTQMFAPRYSLHLVTNTRVISEQDGRIAAQANFLLLQTLVEGPSTIHMAGTYDDVFVRDAQGGLLLQDRQCIYDTTLIANDLVYPL